MSTPKFADVHNLVAFLSKPTESKGFKQIINFLNANPIKEAQLHAKVDGKKVIISEATVRRDLKFKDERGVDCLSNEVIFKQLTLMGNCSSKGDFKFKKESQEIGEEKEVNNSWLKRLYKVGLSDRVESYAEEQSMGEEDASKQERNIADINTDAEITLVDETAEDQERLDDQEMFNTGILDDEEVVVEIAVAVKEVDVAQDQPKIRGIVVKDHKEPSESTTIPTSVADSTRPKAKSIIMQEP
nr:hypothetical protein [Tanacetum cinerariifolium]